MSFLVEKMEKLSNDGELTYQLLSLYEKIGLGKSDVRNSVKSSKGHNGK